MVQKRNQEPEEADGTSPWGNYVLQQAWSVLLIEPKETNCPSQVSPGHLLDHMVELPLMCPSGNILAFNSVNFSLPKKGSQNLDQTSDVRTTTDLNQEHSHHTYQLGRLSNVQCEWDNRRASGTMHQMLGSKRSHQAKIIVTYIIN